MTGAHDSPPRRILAVLDSGSAQTALATAAALADRHGAALEALACVAPPHDLPVVARLAGRDPAHLLDDLRARTRTESLHRLADALPGREVPLTVAVGKTFIEVIGHVVAKGCDFVVKSAEPLSGMQRFFFGSTDQHLLRKCPCPVWLQTPEAPPAPQRILAAVDVDDWDTDEPETLFSLNRRVVETACRIAAPTGAEVTVLHAWEAMGEGMVWAFSGETDARVAAERYVNEVLATRRRALDRLLQEIDTGANTAGGAAGIRLIPRLGRGAPEQVIAAEREAMAADVVVMGTVARTGLSGVFIGNTAENIINTLPCPVVAVKPEGFTSPLAPQ
jgi:nucleotide-binding universal stress UspA family protein